MGAKSPASRLLAAEALANGGTYQAAASAGGCALSTIKRWMTEDQDFRSQVDQLVMVVVERNRNLLVQAKDETVQIRAARTLTAAGLRVMERSKRGDDDYGDLDRYLASR